MKHKVVALFFLLTMLLGMAAYSQTVMLAVTPSKQEPPLRLSEPTDVIIADLESYIPDYMQDKNIPGVAIALIRDGEVAWTRGFGVTNTITHKPATSETLFEVASNSKVVTAYIALQLVDQGLLSLDEPLDTYLTESWLPASEYRDVVTLRHVLSHSSGLGANLFLNRDVQFSPGSHYFYSGIGFLYLQEVLEQVTGSSLEDLAQEMVFEPLGMSSSSFVHQSELNARTANGHVHVLLPVLLFVIPFLISLLLVGFSGTVILRILRGRWRPTWRLVIVGCAVAYVLSLVPALVLLGRIGMLEFVWLIALSGLVLIIVFALSAFAGRVIILRLCPERSRMRTGLSIVWSGLILAGICLLLISITNVPVPKTPEAPASAAGTIRATAGDMATFLIELSAPQHLSSELAAQLQTQQVRLSGDLSWGLGAGIQHSPQGDALWQWGQHIDFQSVLVIYPEFGFGVVVFTNNDLLSPDVAIEIAHRALGGQIEPIRRAIHLDFNYSAGG
jgi:CubicO group peptidase (beta-lactamase class C family)